MERVAASRRKTMLQPARSLQLFSSKISTDQCEWLHTVRRPPQYYLNKASLPMQSGRGDDRPGPPSALAPACAELDPDLGHIRE
eukprot:3127790-Rhodomonas_salina.1